MGEVIRNNREAVGRIRAREPFRNRKGSLSGRWHDVPLIIPSGWAPTELTSVLRFEAGPVYVVYSYGTPIAWVTTDGMAAVPDLKYSVTTSKHQSLVLGALGLTYAETAEAWNSREAAAV